MGLGDGIVPGENHLLGPGVDHLLVLGGLGQVDQDRARSAGLGDVEGLGHDPGDVLCLGDQVGVLGHGVGDAHNIGLLEGVRADGCHTHLAGDHHHGNGVHHGIGYGGDHVGGPGPGGDQADPDPTGGDGVPFGRVPGRLLMTDQGEPESDRIIDGVVGGEDGASRNPEYVCNPQVLQRADQGLRPGHRFSLGGDSRLAPALIFGDRAERLQRCRQTHIFLSTSRLRDDMRSCVPNVAPIGSAAHVRPKPAPISRESLRLVAQAPVVSHSLCTGSAGSQSGIE